MRRRRPALLWLRRILVAGAGLLALLLLPPVQTWLARAVLASVGGVQVEIGRLSLNPWGLRLERLQVEAGGLRLKVAAVESAIAPGNSLAGGLPVFRDVTVRDADITLEVGLEGPPSPDSEPPAGFRGLSPWLRLPIRMAIHKCAASGVFTLIETQAGRRTTMEFDLSGQDWAPASTGRLELDARVRVEGSDKPLAALTIEVSGEATQLADAALSHLVLGVTASGTAAGLAANGPVAVAARGELTIEPEGMESIAVQVTEPGAPDRPPLATLSARLDPATPAAQGRWTLGLRSHDLRPFMQGSSPPELTAEGEGGWGWAGPTGAFHVEGRLKGSGAEWGRWDARLAGIRPFAIDLEADLQSDGKLLQVRTAQLHLTDTEGEPRAGLETRQSFAYDRATARFSVPDVERPVLALSLDQLPVGWARALTGRDTLQGGMLNGELSLTVTGGGVGEVRAVRPLRFDDFQLRLPDGRALPVMDLSLEPIVTWDTAMARLRLAPLQIRAATGAALRFEGEATVPRANLARIEARGDLSLRLPRLTTLIPEIVVLEGEARLGVDLDDLSLSVQQVSARARGGDDSVLIEGAFTAREPLRVEMAPWRAVWSSARVETMQLRLNGFPLAWMTPWLPEVSVTGGGLFGELHVIPRTEGVVRVEPRAPLEIRNLALAFRGEPYPDAMSATLNPELALSEAGSSLTLRDVRLRTAAGDRVDGEALYRTDPARPGTIDATASLEAEFPTLLAAVSKVGALRWSHELSLDIDSRVITFRKLSVRLANLKGNTFLEGELLQPFDVAVQPLRARALGAGADIVRITARPMQIEDLFPWALGLDLSGGAFSGTFLLRATEGRLELATTEPLRVGPVHASWQGHPVFEDLDLELTQEVAYGVAGAEVREVEVRIRHDGEQLGRLATRGSVPLGPPAEGSAAAPRELSVDLELSLPALRDQPIARGVAPFARGRLTGRGKGSALAGDSTVEIAVDFQDVVPEGGEVLPRTTIAMSVASRADGSFDVTLPIRLTSLAGDSDLSLRAVQRPGKERPRVEAALDSDRLVVEDLMALWAAFAPRTAGAEATTKAREPVRSGAPAPPVDPGSPAASGADRLVTALEHLAARRDERPFWGGRRDVLLSLRGDELILDRYRVTDLRGNLTGGAERLVVSALSARALDGTVGLHAEVGFDNASETPYDALFRLGIDRLDGAQFFRAALPDQPPTLEGRYFGVAELRGTGRNPFDLARQITGRIDLRGTNGVFRGLGTGTQRTGKQITLAGRLTFSKGLRALGRFIAGLGEMQFDRFQVSLNRIARGRLQLETFELDARQARMRGKGTLTRDVTRPVAESALDLELRLQTTGNLGIVFDELNLLEAGADESGFRTVRSPLALRGTIGQPDASSLYDLLDEAVAGSRGSLRWAARLARREAARIRPDGTTTPAPAPAPPTPTPATPAPTPPPAPD